MAKSCDCKKCNSGPSVFLKQFFVGSVVKVGEERFRVARVCCHEKNLHPEQVPVYRGSKIEWISPAMIG